MQQPVLVSIARSAIAFFRLLVATHISGRHAIWPTSHLTLAARIALGSMAAALAYNTELNVLNTFVAMMTFACLAYLTSAAAVRWRAVRRLLVGSSVTLIENGKVLECNLRRVNITLDELMARLRLKSIFDIADVEFAVLEPSGRLSVLPKSQKRPLTPADLGIPTTYEGLGSVLILQGQIISANLDKNRLSEGWLRGKLALMGLEPGDVMLAMLNTKGELYVDQYDDRPKPGSASAGEEPPAQNG